MPDFTIKKISELPAASTLNGSEQIPVIQGVTTGRTTTGDITRARQSRIAESALSAAMHEWEVAKSAVSTGIVRVVWLGDSLSHIKAAPTQPPNVVENMLSSILNTRPVTTGFLPVVASWGNLPNPTYGWNTPAGTFVEDDTLPCGYGQLLVPGNEPSHTVVCDGVTLLIKDGGADIAVQLAGVTDSTYTGVNDDGYHLFTATWPRAKRLVSLQVSGAGGEDCYVWPYFHDGNTDKGVQLWNLARSSWGWMDYIGNVGAEQALAVIDPALVVVPLGVGDIIFDPTITTPATWKARVKAGIQWIQANTDASILFGLEAQMVYLWGELYRGAAFEVADETGVAIVDLHQAIKSGPYTANPFWSTDNLHFEVSGAARMGEAIGETLQSTSRSTRDLGRKSRFHLNTVVELEATNSTGYVVTGNEDLIVFTGSASSFAVGDSTIAMPNTLPEGHEVTVAHAGLTGTVRVSGALGLLAVLSAGQSITVKYGSRLLGFGDAAIYVGTPPRPVEAFVTNAGTTRTFGLPDLASIVRFTAAGASVGTIPANATVAFPPGSVLRGWVAGAGGLTFTGATGVTVNGTLAGSKAATQFKLLTAAQSAANVWDVWVSG